MQKKIKWILFIGLAVVVLFAALYAMAAANVMPGSSSLDEYSQPIYPGDVAPVECAGINFTGRNNLVLGTSGNDDPLDGGNGSDCIVGGAGNDVLSGKQGNDVLIGGDGNDKLYAGQGEDICYGCIASETLSGCETIHNVCP